MEKKIFKSFNYYIIERLYMVQKLEYVRSRIKIPTHIYKDTLALNELRNGLAHSFFPENRRVKPKWKKTEIFEIDGFRLFWNETSDISNFFMERSIRDMKRREKKV